MAQHSVETQWMGKMQFNASVEHHTIVMDAPERSGGGDTGPIPKPFILTALTGCAGMEIISMLKKYNIEILAIKIMADGTLTEKIPYYYTSISLKIEVKANDHFEQIKKYIDIVLKERCGVSVLLQKCIPIDWEINFTN
jgi:putative redox protein